MFNADQVLQKTLQLLPEEKKLELSQYSSLSRGEQLEFRKNFILEYGYGLIHGKELYNLVTGGSAALLTVALLTSFEGKGKSLSPKAAEFSKKLAGAFIGGHVGQLMLALYREYSDGNAIRNDTQESFIIGTLAFAGGEGIELLENVFRPKEVMVEGYGKFDTFDMATNLYTAYNAFNFASIAFQLYWQNEMTKAFDRLYPLNPEVPLMPIVNQMNVPISGYRMN